jgi:6-phosphogluconolactonase
MAAESEDLDAAAMAYEAELRLAFDTGPDEVPVFDLVWLGMGPDGHTASLFPDSTGLDVVDRWVVANWAPALETWRMTLTFPVINAARSVVIGAYGANKADALRAIRAGGSDLPAARVDGDHVEWVIDAAAAGEEVAA